MRSKCGGFCSNCAFVDRVLSDASNRVRTMSVRKQPKTATLVSVWAKSAGRCCMCGEPQLNSALGEVTVTIGEVAHQVGATAGSKSPRGKADVPLNVRGAEENLMLLCHGCHRKVDSSSGESVYTVDVLRGIKAQHEAMVAAVTDFRTENRTLVISTRSTVRDRPVRASPSEIAYALVESRRAPYVRGNLAYRVEIDLTDSVREEWGWKRGMKRIDEAMDLVGRDIADGSVDHLSVFALAPIPLLAYFGHKLSDKGTVAIFRRTRRQTDRAWCWDGHSGDPAPTFDIEVPNQAGGFEELVVLLGLTAPVRLSRLPLQLAHVPVAQIGPNNMSPNPDILETRESVDAFAASWREFLAQLEDVFPNVRRLHVVAAVPAPAAVALGRFHRSGIDPTLIMYERHDDSSYSAVLEIPA